MKKLALLAGVLALTAFATAFAAEDDAKAEEVRGRDRLAAVQVRFAEGMRCRDDVILSRTQRNQTDATGASWWARSLAHDVAEGELDLRRRDHAQALAARLEALDLASITG